MVLAGEDSTDRKCLRVLLEAFCPDMRGRIVEINDSVRLRQASGENLSSRVRALAGKVRARAKREAAQVACVFVHEDFDAVDSSDYPTARKRVQEALECHLSSAHYVLAVWEMEAWLLLFPNVLSGFVASWKVPAKHRNKDTGRLTDPKRILMNECSSSQRRYLVSDAPAVFRKVAESKAHEKPTGSNRSWQQFRQDAKYCCAEHL